MAAADLASNRFPAKNDQIAKQEERISQGDGKRILSPGSGSSLSVSRVKGVPGTSTDWSNPNDQGARYRILCISFKNLRGHDSVNQLHT